ncbi:glycosyltransferase family 2 protein [Actinoplanes sp. NPDC051411]|uniref:glycosyltransferase n=1 Tax=Actinoplanes sp. NPDC051411 TaxID=3155522 RepID=UPI003445ED66
MTPARLAVVIPAHNEHLLLPACLHSVFAAPAPVPVEVIVVADACTDDTAALASAAGASVVTVAARNVGRARDAGMRHALRTGPEGLWLATTDADSRVPPGWLRWHLAHFRGGADLLAGTVIVDDWSSWPPDLPARYERRYRSEPLHPHGANMGISGQAYRRAGGFPPVRHGEDVALLTRVRHKEGHIVADASCPVVTSARRQSRAPDGFAAHLAAMAAQPIGGTVDGRRGRSSRLS